jgi:hypothetical protein
MMGRTGKLHEGETGNDTTTAGSADAVGKQSLVQQEMARMGAAAAGSEVAGDAPRPSEADRVADLANRAGAADPRGTGPQAFPAPASASPKERHDAACTRLALIEDSIKAEDTARVGDEAKDDKVEGKHSVEAQLAATGTRKAAMNAREPSFQALASKTPIPAVVAFETAVRAYQDAYERTYLVSTDRPVDKTAKWEATDQRDRLSNKTAKGRLVEWAKLPYIKFAIPVGHPTDVYIGIEPLSHVAIAEDNVLTAGILKVTTEPLRVSELGNSSGGYRPGPLRNALVLARFIDHGIVQDDLAGTAVDNRPDGTYTHSHVTHPEQ